MRYTLLILSILVSFVGYSQTYDDKIAEAMNSEDWFALDSIYSSAPKDSIDPFLEVFSRCVGRPFQPSGCVNPGFSETA